MSIHKQYKCLTFAVVLLATGLTLTTVQADDRDIKGRSYHDKKHDKTSGSKDGGESRGKPAQPPLNNARFEQECSSCHIAYAPGLLPAGSWRKIMSGLEKHFGSDASIDAQDNREITAFLVGNASNRWSAPTAPIRITESAWFKRKHGEHEIGPSIWKNPMVKSPSNCAACHLQAESGNFNKHDILIPR